jgi:hypothetical protein
MELSKTLNQFRDLVPNARGGSKWMVRDLEQDDSEYLKIISSTKIFENLRIYLKLLSDHTQ